MSNKSKNNGKVSSSPRKTIIICVALLAIAATVMWVINNTEPEAERAGAMRKSAALVDTITVQRGDYTPRIIVLGHVEATHEVFLSPEVSGRVTTIDPAFEPGGFVKAGAPLVTLQKDDYETALAMRQSELQEAKAALAMEQGRTQVAQKEYQMLETSLSDENKALVLRTPQLQTAQANLAAAEAQVQQAKLDLERTTVKAPFAAHVLERQASPGSQVTPGSTLGHLIGIDQFRVVAAVPQRNLRWLKFPENNETGSPVTLRHRQIWQPNESRQGTLSGLISKVDEQTRLARVIITVNDPLAHNTDSPALQAGSIVEAEISGRPITNVIQLNRDYLRAGDTVWVKKDGLLEIRKVEVEFRDAHDAYIRNGLESGDEIVTTSLATVKEGIPLKRIESE